MQHTPVPPQAAPPRSEGTTVLLAALWGGWVLVPAWLALSAVGHLLAFFGEQPTEAEQAQARSLLLRAAVVAVVLPLIGLVVSLRTGRRRNAVASGCALALSGVVALVVGVAAAQEAGPDVQPRDREVVCQERSGGGNDCPGG
ncbi:hypothetical protein [Blastococcus sp. SYSU D00813]